MIVFQRTTAFKRAYRKLTAEKRRAVDSALLLFAEDPFDPRLHNHKLSGTYEGVRFISAGYDLRILFVHERSHLMIIFIAVGSHDDVY